MVGGDVDEIQSKRLQETKAALKSRKDSRRKIRHAHILITSVRKNFSWAPVTSWLLYSGDDSGQKWVGPCSYLGHFQIKDAGACYIYYPPKGTINKRI